MLPYSAEIKVSTTASNDFSLDDDASTVFGLCRFGTLH